MTFFKKNNNGQFIGVEFTEYKGKRYINIREYYTSDNDEKRPTKKGVTFSADSLPQLVAAVQALVSAGVPKAEEPKPAKTQNKTTRTRSSAKKTQNKTTRTTRARAKKTPTTTASK